MNKLRELRKERNLTLLKTACDLELPFETYRSYEIGRRQADYDTLIRIANYFGVSVDYLLGREEKITQDERAAGASETRSVKITPIEDDMLYTFREIGKRFGEEAQRDYITVAENMLKLGKK